ncbi:MAG TPA: Mut7-C RNAse domain-containing protein [Terriglobia bacterium]|nr:Mut7-C RNAse domain-containing protein [Terriglobia bacterium]
MPSASEIRFVADRMLGRLARTLRLLGYDTLYSSTITPAEVTALAAGERIILTCGYADKRFPGCANVFSIASDYAPEQLGEVVRAFHLDTRTGLWSRCTLCNTTIEPVEKSAIRAEVEPKVYELYSEFYRCSGCGHVYWRGSHVERILRNLDALLGRPPEVN